MKTPSRTPVQVASRRILVVLSIGMLAVFLIFILAGVLAPGRVWNFTLPSWSLFHKS